MRTLANAAFVCMLLSVALVSCRKKERLGTATSDFGATSRTQSQTSTRALSLRHKTVAQSWRELDNPANDGWDGEALAIKSQTRLDDLWSRWIDPSEAFDESVLADYFADDIQAAGLRQSSSQVFSSGLLHIRRSNRSPYAQSYSGRPAVASAFLSHLSWLRNGRYEVTSKVTNVTLLRSKGWSTEVYVSFLENEGSRRVERHSTWQVNWFATSNSIPKIADLRIGSTEQVVRQNSAEPLFVECTPSLLAKNTSYLDQILRGCHDHDRRFPSRLSLVDLACIRGFAVGDVNGDGLEDLYLCEDPGLPNRLFVQAIDGTLNDVSTEWGVDWLEDSRSALLLDLDNDGDQDLAIGVHRSLVILSNERGKRFQLRAVIPTHESVTHLSAADYDLDGKVDLYVGVYSRDEFFRDRIGGLVVGSSAQHLLYDSNAGDGNHLFRNLVLPDRWEFMEVTQSSGLDQNNRRFTFATSWDDFDHDGDQDLYVANDYGRNNLYRNDMTANGGRRFVDIAPEVNAEDQAGGMSVSWGDYDRDGWMDVYVGNMWSAAGKRVTSQPIFKPNITADVRNLYKRVARGNTLLKNTGNGQWQDVSESNGAMMGRWAWASPFVDINNDGWDDIFVANGYLSGRKPATGDL